jgi:RimJ/RimL family protein N-acetyltransferase
MLDACSDLFSLTIRPLTASDVNAYRELRQKILVMGDGRYFSDSYKREAQLSESGWLEWCTETSEHCILGTFDSDRLIGTMMITQHGAIEERMVEWEAIWLDSSYRKQGIAKLGYEYMEQWTIDNGYERVALYIRIDNERSQDIHLRQGAQYMSTKPAEIWADRSVADAYAYRLKLPTIYLQNEQQNRALQYLKTTLASLEPANSTMRASSATKDVARNS